MVTAPSFKWTRNHFGGHELRVDGVEGSSRGFKGSLAYVCKVMSLTPGKPVGCSVSYPGWDGESQTYHRDLEEGRSAAEAAVLPYVKRQLAAKVEAETNAILAVLRAHRLIRHSAEDAPECSCGDWEPETATRDLEEHDEHVAAMLTGRVIA